MQNQARIIALREHLSRTIVGQADLLDKLVIALLAGGCHTSDEEFEILQRDRAAKAVARNSAANTADILAARDEIKAVHIEPMLER